ncbi:type VI secretion system baseplate subunit TssF [Rheinheimera baltica]|uniref:type VI secretion system baseplate subunit TssF n=1 Tax=Rheinheimera baltica TaxID=67576 RepID=UPI00273E822A|nr:type VI secretion system baseplate subunit TssF [Rheinheimera baltica]MDP5143325.1 type VI secretion system baseplate subunit TssF [Rheinheimera baltica]MDP5151159.1 type VI secretion system baseplate subunit TssF [Rheinheimera baltica]
MNDELLKYYNRELTYIRRMGAEFADQYPKIAGRLRLSEENVEDPHVSRLIEGVALLTAQIRQKLDDSFPELTDALLGQLYPDYQAPIPSTSVLKLTSQNLSNSGITVARGTEFETRTDGLKPCTFQACYNTEIWPLDVVTAEFKNAPFHAPKPPVQTNAKALLKLSIACEFDNTAMHELELSSLRFYLNGQRHHVYKLYELLLSKLLAVGIAPTGQPEAMQFISVSQLQAVGFADEHQVVPYSQRSFTGYRLLIEQFLFPEKFLFVELQQLNPAWPGVEDKFDLYFYLAEGADELERHITADSMLLGCTPVINLFSQKLEPVNLDASQYEYRLVPRYMDADVCEVIRIEKVQAFDPFGNEVTLNPYYSQGHPDYLQQQDMFWHSRREFADWAGGYSETGTEMYLSVVDRKFQGVNSSETSKDWVVQVRALCSNRNLPGYLPFGGGEPRFLIRKHADVIKEVRCLMAPTPSVRPALQEASRWQLVNHLTLNHFTGQDALIRLKETLQLYDFRCTPESKALIDGICGLDIKSGTARVNQQGRTAVCSGSEILLEFTQSSYAGSSIYFFANILDMFFAQYAAVNSYTRLSIKLKEHEQVYHRWPARSGTKVLL